MEQEVCERCYLPNDPQHMASFAYGDITLRICLTCMQTVLGVLVRTRLPKRAARLRGMKANWQRRFAGRLV